MRVPIIPPGGLFFLSDYKFLSWAWGKSDAFFCWPFDSSAPPASSLVGDVLVERNVEEVLPSVSQHKDNVSFLSNLSNLLIGFIEN